MLEGLFVPCYYCILTNVQYLCLSRGQVSKSTIVVACDCLFGASLVWTYVLALVRLRLSTY